MYYLKKTVFITATIFSLFLIGCGGESKPDSPPTTPVVSLSISPTTANVTVGESRTFTVTHQNTDFTLSAPSTAGCARSGNTVTCMPTVAGTYTVTVTSTADTSKTTSATIMVSEKGIDDVPTGGSKYAYPPTPPAHVSDGTYTRGQWIKLLGDKLGFEYAVDLEDWDCFYGDTCKHTHGLAIEIAEAHGILPQPDSEGYADPEQDVPFFYPDGITTREFAAYVAITAMGFIESEYVLTCDDYVSLKYPREAMLAVGEGFLALVGGSFLPDTPLSQSDSAGIFAAIDALAASMEVDTDNPREEVVYAEGVVVAPLSEVTDFTVIENGDGTMRVTLPKNAATDAIQPGSVFLLPPNDVFFTATSYKAISISETENNTLEVLCAQPEWGEVVESLFVEAKLTPLIDKIILEDGVTFEYDPNGRIDDDDSVYSFNNIGGSFSPPGKLKLSTELDGFTVTVDLEIPDVTVRATIDTKYGIIPELEDFLAVISTKTKHTLGIKTVDKTESVNFNQIKKKLVTIPLVGGWVAGVNLDVHLVFSYKGGFEIVFSKSAAGGIQKLKNGTIRRIHDFSGPKIVSFKFKEDIRLGIEVGGFFHFTGLNLVTLAVEGGVGFNGSVTAYVSGPPYLCVDGTFYVYLDVKIDHRSLIGWSLNEAGIKVTWSVFDENNSPFKKKFHSEDFGPWLDHCTRKNGGISGHVYDATTNLPISGARVAVYNGNTLLRTVYSMSDGRIDFGEHGITSGERIVRITATGYWVYETTVIVHADQVTELEVFLFDRSSRTMIFDGALVHANDTNTY